MLKLLLEKENVSVDALDNSKNTVFHYICKLRIENSELILLLLEKRANPNLLNIYEYSPFFHFCERQNPKKEIIVKMIEKEGKIDLQSKGGKTPYHLLITKENFDLELLKIISQTRSNVNIADEKGNTAFANYCEEANLKYEILSEFFNCYQPNLNSIDSNKQTPLHKICKNSTMQTNFIQLLIEKKASISQLDNSNNNPLIYALKNSKINHQICVLLSAHFGLEVLNKEGMYPFQVAATNKFKFIFFLFCIKNFFFFNFFFFFFLYFF